MNDRQTELKEHSAHIFEMGCMERPVYLKEDVDAVIAGLKAENERLKKCEIWMKQHFYCEEVIACESAKNRRLKRALWLARSYRGRDNSILLPSKFMRNVWDNVERKCLKKAEQYK
jgi:hypothetical protein